MLKRNPVDFVLLPKTEKQKFAFAWFKAGESKSSIAWTLKTSLPTITRWLSKPEPESLQSEKLDNLALFLRAFPDCKEAYIPGDSRLCYVPAGSAVYRRAENIIATKDIKAYIKKTYEDIRAARK